MKRFLSLALLLGLGAPALMTGCDDTTKVTDEKTISTPDGGVKVTTEKTIEESGDMKGAVSGNPTP